MNVSDWITLAAVLVALALGVSSLIQTRMLQNRERKERLLNEIIDWAISISKCGSEINFLCLAANIDEQAWGDITLPKVQASLIYVQQRGNYVSSIATSLRLPLRKEIDNLMDLTKAYLSELESVFINIRLGAMQAMSLEDVLKTLIDKPDLVSPSIKLIEEATKIKTSL